jgi:hypothetical protein
MNRHSTPFLTDVQIIATIPFLYGIKLQKAGSADPRPVVIPLLWKNVSKKALAARAARYTNDSFFFVNPKVTSFLKKFVSGAQISPTLPPNGVNNHLQNRGL